MTSKLTPTPLVTEHYRTLRDVRTGKLRRRDFATFLGLPVGLGVVSWLLGLRMPSVGDLVQGVAILTGLLFALVIFVFQLRIQVGSNLDQVRRDHVLLLIDELFSNVLYAVAAGLVATVVVVTAGMWAKPNAQGDAQPLDRWWTAVVVISCLHLLLTIAMCLKRTRAAYVLLRS
ncbi:hypothetical protein OHA70_15455 [Kribbella sp. NBC_00382]|uniref:hypothetical protein n=1 Tax=Kribbella sp. NBC_00382 TaxID=2975967 RepID=UPI002E216FD7